MRKARTLAAGVAMLALLAAGAHAQISNPSFEDAVTYTDEAIVLTGTTATAFAHTPVIPQTVVVTNQAKTITYVHGTDYTLGGGARIQRTSTSTIPSGSTVLVTYQVPTLSNWTRYGYTIPGEGATAVLPSYGSPGAEGNFDVLYPNQGASDGYVVCGYQGWGDPKDGGVYQTFDVTSGAGVLLVAARAFSLDFSFHELDIGNRVRAGLVSGAATDRSAVTTWYGENYWGAGWSDISIPVPGPGTYTLFIENHTPWGSGIWNDLWDNVRLEVCQVAIVDGPSTNVTQTSATIEWDTDVPSTSIVYWDQNGPPYDNTSTGDPGTHHSVTLNDLAECATYHYSIKSEAPPCAPATSPDLTFMTACPPCGPTMCNGDFEDTDGGGAPTLVPWHIFGGFDGLHGPGVPPPNDDTYGVPPHSPTHYCGDVESYGNGGNNSGVFQCVTTTPGVQYMARTYIYTQNVGGVPQNTTARIGIDPEGGTNPNAATVQWNINGDTWSYTQHWQTGQQLGWQPIYVFATAAGNVATVFLQVQHKFADAWNITAFDDVTFGEASVATTVAECKAQPPGWPVDMAGRAVTYVYSNPPYFCYVEDDDRVAGIKVAIPDEQPVPSVGDRIDIVGNTEVVNNEAQVAATGITIGTPETPPDPLAATNKSVDGGLSGLQPGIPGGAGLASTGLLLRVFGKCVAVDSLPYPINWLCPFWIDDGCGVEGGTRYDTGGQVTGLRVYYGFATAPYAVGHYLLVTGVAGVEMHDPTPDQQGSGDEYPIRVLYMRDDNDVVDLGAH
jgi:hypothetical protein